MSSIQSECQSSQIRGENPITTYTFNDGKISSPIDIKGDMPDSGYIMLDNNCEILRYYLDEDIAKIASLLSSSANGIIYVDEVKDTYPEVTGWTYQQL